MTRGGARQECCSARGRSEPRRRTQRTTDLPAHREADSALVSGLLSTGPIAVRRGCPLAMSQVDAVHALRSSPVGPGAIRVL